MSRARAQLVWAALGWLVAAAAPALAQNSFSEDVRTTHPSPSRAPSQPAETTPPPSPHVAPGGAREGSGPAGSLPGAGAAPSGETDPRFAKVAAVEAQDFGVAPTEQLRGDPMHAPTPTRIPGGLVITTGALNALYERGGGSFIVFDVLGGQRGLPGAQNALPAGRGGSFDDATQRDFGNYLQQVTRGQKDTPLVFYCQSVYCWMSYNAALRAIRLGYTQVFWFRGGIEAWQQAGLPTYSREG